MKVLAIGSLVKQLTPEQRGEIMQREVPATLRLYLDGKIEQHWFRQDKPAVVFLMNVDSVDDAQATVSTLPLTAEGIMTFDLMPVGPLAPLGLLIQGK
jgi:muconolactone delta-isomerase